MRIVLDTNVYIAAFLRKSLASKILLQGKEGGVSIYVSGEIIFEIKRILSEKFKVDKEKIGSFIQLVDNSTHFTKPTKKLDVIRLDPNDNMILECAVEAEANLIVTMDKHLLKLKSYGETGIIHPKTLTWVLPKIIKSYQRCPN